MIGIAGGRSRTYKAGEYERNESKSTHVIGPGFRLVMAGLVPAIHVLL